MARQRPTRGRRRGPSRPFVGRTGVDDARRRLVALVDRCAGAVPAVWAAAVRAAQLTAVHVARLAAVRVPGPSSVVPGWVVRGVTIAGIVAVAATGAVTGLTAQDGGAGRSVTPDGAAVVPAPPPPPAADPGALTVPAPAVPSTGVVVPPPTVLDPPAPRVVLARDRTDSPRPSASKHRDKSVTTEHTDHRSDDTDAKNDSDARDADRRNADARPADQADPGAGQGTGDEVVAAPAAAAGNAAGSRSPCNGRGSLRTPLRTAVQILGCAVGGPTSNRRRGLSLRLPGE